MFYCCKNKLFTACFGNIYNACVMGKLYNFKLISRILLLCNKVFGILNNLPMGCRVRHTFAVGKKSKGKFLYSAVSSPQDRSKHFTLYFPDRPVHSDTIPVCHRGYLVGLLFREIRMKREACVCSFKVPVDDTIIMKLW